MPIKPTNPENKRLTKCLDQPYRDTSTNEVYTLRQRINSGYFIKAEAKRVGALTHNRRQYNRMDAKEQQEWDRRNEKGKTEYRLHCSDTVFIPVPKIVHDHFIELSTRDTDNVEPIEYISTDTSAALSGIYKQHITESTTTSALSS